MSQDMVPAHNVTTIPTKIRLPMRSLPFYLSARCGSRCGRLNLSARSRLSVAKKLGPIHALFYPGTTENAMKCSLRTAKDLVKCWRTTTWRSQENCLFGDTGQGSGRLT